MKNSKTTLPALAILLCVSLSCSFLKDKISSGGEPATEFGRISKLPPINPDGPLVSPGAVAVRKLAEIDPSVASFVDSIEATERSAMKKTIAAIRTEPDDDKKKEKASSSFGNSDIGSSGLAKPVVTGRPVAALMMFQAGDTSLPGIGDGIFLGAFIGTFKSMLADAGTGNFNKKESRTEVNGGTTSIMNYEVGVNPDGTSILGFGVNTESTKNGVKVTTEMHGKIEGDDCPNAEGQVQITVKLRLSARSGAAGYTQDVTVFIRMVVDDNANVATTTIDLTQGTSRGKNGQETYVETGETIKYNSGEFGSATRSNQGVIQKTDNATASDIDEAWTSGLSAAYGAAIGAIATAESTWKGGGCIKIEAKSPGSVDPGAGIEIPVKVRHKKDGSEIAAKLDVVLAGETSIDPTLIPKTPGTLMYVAPGETGKSATIKLTATSRRGIAKLDLTASTGTNSYRIAGGLDEWYTNTIVCDITKPFTLTGTHGIKAEFSGGLSGTYTYSGTSFSAQGSGTYEINFPHGRELAGEMIGQGPGTVKGDGRTWTGSGTETYTLTTVDGPCVDGPVKE